MNLNIETYSGKLDDEIISLSLSIQNEEAKIGLALYNELLKYAVSKEAHRSCRCRILIPTGKVSFIY